VVVIENSWTFLKGKLADGSGTTAGDGNGFKLGGAAASGDAYEGGAACGFRLFRPRKRRLRIHA
jgi:hypothetical protein